MKILVKRLIANKYGGSLVALKTLSETPIDQQNIGSIVVHAVIVLLSRNKADILLPFYYMLHDPSALAVRDIIEYFNNVTYLILLFLYTLSKLICLQCQRV